MLPIDPRDLRRRRRELATEQETGTRIGRSLEKAPHLQTGTVRGETEIARANDDRRLNAVRERPQRCDDARVERLDRLPRLLDERVHDRPGAPVHIHPASPVGAALGDERDRRESRFSNRKGRVRACDFFGKQRCATRARGPKLERAWRLREAVVSGGTRTRDGPRRERRPSADPFGRASSPTPF